MAIVTRDFQSELRAANQQVKTLGSQREKLVGDARVEQERVKQTVEALKGFGIADADQLSIEELTTLRDKAQGEMESGLDTIQQQLAQAQAVMAEYGQVA